MTVVPPLSSSSSLSPRSPVSRSQQQTRGVASGSGGGRVQSLVKGGNRAAVEYLLFRGIINNPLLLSTRSCHLWHRPVAAVVVVEVEGNLSLKKKLRRLTMGILLRRDAVYKNGVQKVVQGRVRVLKLLPPRQPLPFPFPLPLQQ